MNSTLQTIIALSMVVGAFAFFALRWWHRRKKQGCGGGCGCSDTKPFWKK